MSVVANLITNAFGMDVSGMEVKASLVNKRYAGIFR
jgi:hypothetical protein